MIVGYLDPWGTLRVSDGEVTRKPSPSPNPLSPGTLNPRPREENTPKTLHPEPKLQERPERVERAGA